MEKGYFEEGQTRIAPQVRLLALQEGAGSAVGKMRGVVRKGGQLKLRWSQKVVALAYGEVWPNSGINLLWLALGSLRVEFWHLVPARRVLVIIG